VEGRYAGHASEKSQVAAVRRAPDRRFARDGGQVRLTDTLQQVAGCWESARAELAAPPSTSTGWSRSHASPAHASAHRGFEGVARLRRRLVERHTQRPSASRRSGASGAFISQTWGHGDFRLPYEVPRGVAGHLSHGELLGGAAIADGVPEVMRATREQLMRGASQIKVMAGRRRGFQLSDAPGSTAGEDGALVLPR
jgi:hypothetical protein